MKRGDLCRFYHNSFAGGSSSNSVNDRFFIITDVYWVHKQKKVDIMICGSISAGWDYDTLYDISKEINTGW